MLFIGGVLRGRGVLPQTVAEQVRAAGRGVPRRFEPVRRAHRRRWRRGATASGLRCQTRSRRTARFRRRRPRAAPGSPGQPLSQQQERSSLAGTLGWSHDAGARAARLGDVTARPRSYDHNIQVEINREQMFSFTRGLPTGRHGGGDTSRPASRRRSAVCDRCARARLQCPAYPRSASTVRSGGSSFSHPSRGRSSRSRGRCRS